MCSPFNYNIVPTPNCSRHRSRTWLLQHIPTLLTLQMLSEQVQSSGQTGKRVSSTDSGLDFYWNRGTAAGKPLIFPLSFLREKSLFSVTFFQSVIIQTLHYCIHLIILELSSRKMDLSCTAFLRHFTTYPLSLPHPSEHSLTCKLGQQFRKLCPFLHTWLLEHRY